MVQQQMYPFHQQLQVTLSHAKWKNTSAKWSKIKQQNAACHFFSCTLRLKAGLILTARVRSTREGNVLTPVCVSVHTFRGGPRSQIFGGSQVSDFRGRGGTQSQIFGGGVPGLRFFLGGSQVSDFGGVPSLRFSGGGYLVSVKGKIFDTRFGFIHVQTRKKIFVVGPPPSKGKNFWHQIWLDTCSDWEKKFLSRDIPPQ